MMTAGQTCGHWKNWLLVDCAKSLFLLFLFSLPLYFLVVANTDKLWNENIVEDWDDDKNPDTVPERWGEIDLGQEGEVFPTNSEECPDDPERDR